MKKFNSLVRISLALTFLSLFSGCTTVPMTNRRQFTLIPSNQMLSLSQQQYAQVLGESKLSDNQQQKALIQKVGNRIAAAVDDYYRENGLQNNFQWEYNLIEDDETVNAWCMPGGKIAFYTGILKYTQDETGIAAVMGHEIAHAIAKHGNERMSQGLLAQAGTTVLSTALANKPQATQQLFMTAFGVGTQVGILLPFGRKHESEADRIGLILMAKAGYDPHAAIDFWKRMAQSKKAAPPEFLSTHPSDQRRINDIRSHLPEALAHYPGSSTAKPPAKTSSQEGPSTKSGDSNLPRIDWRRSQD